MSRRRSLLVSSVLALAVAAVVGWFWVGSLVPSTYSVTDMGYADDGTGATTSGPGHHHGAGAAPMAAPGEAKVAGQVLVSDLVGDRTRAPDVSYTLTVAHGPHGGYTVNGTSPGPVVEATQGELVQVVLRNEDVEGGARPCTGTAWTCPTARTASPA